MSLLTEILNNIRSVSGAEYQARVPEATRTNITAVGNTIIDYTPTRNQFLTELVNRIGKTIVDKMESMDDIFTVFSEGSLELGDTLQKIFIEIPTASAFKDGSEQGYDASTMLKQQKGVIHVEYSKVDRRIFYKQTITIELLKEAFTSESKLTELVMGLIESMASALSYDKYVMDVEAIYKACSYCALNGVNGLVVPSTVATYDDVNKVVVWDDVGAKAFLKILRIKSRSLKFPHSLSYFDEDEVEHTINYVRTPVNKQVIGLEVSTLANIDVDALAVLFNMSKAESEVRQIELEDNIFDHVEDSAETEYHLGGFICHKDAVERYTTFIDSESFRNKETLATNYWLHYWGFRAVSKLKDFVPILFTIQA